LRALASTGQPIVLGYVMTVALGIFMFLKKSIPNRAVWMAGMILLIAGLIAPLSRGPWIGAAIMLMVFISTGPKALSRTSLLGLVGLVALPILLSTPIGEKVISYLPFVGTVEEETITYRQLLLEVSTTIIMANPLFGSYDFLLYLEELRQGQGIIDLVNSYLSIALASGLVGLSLFASFFSVILIGIVKGMRGLDKNDERHLLGRVLIAALIGILVIIFTVSSINVIPVIYWAVAGLGVAYARMLALATVSLKVPEASRHVIFPAAIMKAKPERYPGP
ncbi:MAG: O-antigen ligase family protein, partial [Rugosibacter sp.]|nr:O-antigen ligase family protein [Rugosibacter sp.]